MAAAALSLACPLRRSTRLSHRRFIKYTSKHTIEHDDELTPRALRALKRQRLAIDPDAILPFSRSRKRRNTTTKRKPLPPRTSTYPPPVPTNDVRPASSPTSKPERPPSPDSEPLTPLTPSPESSPGHDRHSLPPPDPLPTPDPPPVAYADPALDTLIPFDGLYPHFDPDLAVPIHPPPTPPSHLQPLELQGQFHSFPQHQLYVPPNPVFVRDREINIWKLACQERVDCLLRRYGVDYIKGIVESQARTLPRSSFPSGTSTPPPSQTKFRLYTPASYTYSLSSWSSASGPRKPFPVHLQGDDPDPTWPMDDPDWVDADVDMEDEDEDDYEDEDDTADPDAERDGEATLDAVQGLVIADTATPNATAMQVDSRLPTTRSVPDPPPRPSTPLPHAFPPPPPLTPPTLPPLSSLHVPLLSEPPRAFMGRGTPPDRRRLVEWSGSGRFATNGMGPPLYLSPVPQHHPNGIVSMSVDSPMQSMPSQPPHTHGEWTSFLYSMLEGDGVGVGIGTTNVAGTAHPSEPSWYELGLASVSPVVPELTATRTPTPPVEQSVDEGSNSSSTLRFALG